MPRTNDINMLMQLMTCACSCNLRRKHNSSSALESYSYVCALTDVNMQQKNISYLAVCSRTRCAILKCRYIAKNQSAILHAAKQLVFLRSAAVPGAQVGCQGALRTDTNTVKPVLSGMHRDGSGFFFENK